MCITVFLCIEKQNENKSRFLILRFAHRWSFISENAFFTPPSSYKYKNTNASKLDILSYEKNCSLMANRLNFGVISWISENLFTSIHLNFFFYKGKCHCLPDKFIVNFSWMLFFKVLACIQATKSSSLVKHLKSWVLDSERIYISVKG